MDKKQKSSWSFVITFISFILSVVFMIISTSLLKGVDSYIAFLIVLVIVFIGVIFDMIGVAVTAASEVPLHAMASKKYIGAKEAVGLIRNADKVASFCNDVIGDICGIVSGTAVAYVFLRLFSGLSEKPIWEIIITSLVAALTVGGKAVGKSVAINNSNYIVYKVGVILAFSGLSGIISGKKRQ